MKAQTVLEIYLSLLLSCLGVLVAGFVLSQMVEEIETIPGLLALVPPLMNMRGCISGALAMRLGSAFHLGLLSGPSKREELKQNVCASLLLTLATSVAIGVLAYVVCLAAKLPVISLPALLAISVVAGVLSSLLTIAITISIAITSSAKGLDPDNVTVPLVTTVGDVVAIICIFATVVLLWPLI